MIVHLFSGRRDPETGLAAEEIGEIRHILAGLPARKGSAPSMSARPLGYGGIEVLLGDGGRIDVFHEDVRVYSVSASTRELRDEQAQLEHFLVGLARSRLDEALPWGWITDADRSGSE